MRTAKKTASYSLMHLTVAFGVAYVLTGSWKAALAIGTIEPIFQTVAFAVHERVWTRLDLRAKRNAAPAAAAA